MTDAVLNTDRELYRVPDVGGNGDYYLDRIHVTQGGSIGINVGGLVIVKPLSEWHELAQDAVAQQVRIDKLEEALKSVADYVSDAADGKLWAYNHGWAMKRVDTEMAAEDQVRIREALKGPE